MITSEYAQVVAYGEVHAAIGSGGAVRNFTETPRDPVGAMRSG
jgi:hypothetical protein